MSGDYGQFGSVVAAAGSLMAAVGALILTWKNRASWEPVEEDIPRGAQRFAGLVAAVVIGLLWYSQHAQVREGASSLPSIAIWCVVAAVVCALGYSLLIGIYTYERQVATGPHSVSRQKIIGGFILKPQARDVLKAQPVLTTQELLKGAAYDADKVWTTGSRSAAKVSFFLAYMGMVVFGTVALASVAMALVQSGPPSPQQVLAEATKRWIEAAEVARKNGTIVSGAPLPTALASPRADFEAAWRNAGLGERSKLEPNVASKALSYCVGVYRIQEENEAVKTNALHWADEAIRHFEERQNRPLLVEALLDKAAIMLDLAQQENTSKDAFENVSKTGDSLMTRVASIASPEKRAEVYRLSSRFYYNLSRPKSFRLSDAWDNNYLLLAHARAKSAYELMPQDIKNCNQLLRATMKAAKNPPQDMDRQWTQELRSAQAAMKEAWQRNDATTTSAVGRRSALSVLGTGTLEAVARDWHELEPSKRRAAASALSGELASDSLPQLREAEALLQNGELKNAYGFDVYYDIARAYAQRVVMLRLVDRARAAREFPEVRANLNRARENANARQLDAAMKDIELDLSFSKLSVAERGQLASLLRVGVK
ncbi:MAG: hypothetical protein IE917_14015 [Betaproteobacteria bacterium]|nr:hypothetical protein [Betaproteobacteria bacterium]